MSPSNPDWLSEPELQRFFAAVKEAGGEARAVGGCVRDHLRGVAGGDVDLASTLSPETTTALCGAKGWKVKPTGIAHGTVTVILPARVMEVTTLRRDVETFGRHANVEYTDRFEEDAARRDFTINALYMDASGEIYDFFGGQDDLAKKQLRFIGDAHARIGEDGLRILRYFRFLATLGWQADAQAVAACAAHAAMLTQLSGERIQQEMKKLLAAPDPSHALKQMAAIGLSKRLTGGDWDFSALHFLLQQTTRHKRSPWLTLAVLVTQADKKDAVKQIAARWKLSRADAALLGYLATSSGVPADAAVKEWLRANPREWVIARMLYLSARDRQSYPLTLAETWEVPTFPVAAKDLKLPEGPEVGKRLKALEKRWVESNYSLSKEELLK